MASSTMTAQGALATKEINILSMLAPLRRWWWLFLLSVALTTAFAWFRLQKQIPLYAARAEILLEETRSPINLGSILGEGQITNSVLQTEVKVLPSQGVMEMTAERLRLRDDEEFIPKPQEPGALRLWLRGLKSLWASPIKTEVDIPSEEELTRRAADALRSRISVDPVRTASILGVQAVSRSPEKAALLANAIAQSYLDLRVQNKLDKQKFAVDFITRRAEELRAEVEKAENAVQEFRNSKGILTNKPPEIELFENLNARHQIARNLTSSLRDQIGRLEARLKAARGTQSGPASSNEERAQIERSLKETRDDLASAMEREAALAASRDEMRQKVSEKTAHLVELAQLEREAAATRALFENFLTRQKETSAQQDLLLSPDARIITQAQPPYKPSSPNPSLFLGLGALFGVILGLGGVFVLESVGDGFMTAEELEEASKQTVLGVIPLDRKSRGRSDALRRAIGAPSGRITESIRNLRTGLLLSNIDTPPKTILVTSSLPSEGKSLIAALLGGVTSQMEGKKTLIIDADLRRRTLHETLNTPSEPGLLAVLSGKATIEEALRVDQETKLHAICVEENNVNAPDILASQAFRVLMERLRERYDMIIIDAPPTLPVSDARILCGFADAVIYVVRWNKTPRGAVRQGLNMLRSVGAPLSGLVLSQVDYGSSSHKSSANYASYNSYYKE